MGRPTDHFIFLTNAEWIALDPVVPANTYAVSTDLSIQKLGDGTSKWSTLIISGAGSIGTKLVQSDREPSNNETVVFCSATDKWTFKDRGCFLSETEIEGMGLEIPIKFYMILEIDDVTLIPTGRFKIADGVYTVSQLPWMGVQ